MKTRGVSNGALARKTVVSPSTVGRWLTGAHPQPSVLMRIADALHIRSDWLTDGIGTMDADDEEPSEAVKDLPSKSRLTATSPMYRSRLPAPSPASLSASPINAAASRLSVEELEQMIVTVVGRMSEEDEPLIKLGYLTTIKACTADLERRLAEPSQ